MKMLKELKSSDKSGSLAFVILDPAAEERKAFVSASAI
jgi:hypothetical protein